MFVSLNFHRIAINPRRECIFGFWLSTGFGLFLLDVINVSLYWNTVLLLLSAMDADKIDQN